MSPPCSFCYKLRYLVGRVLYSTHIQRKRSEPEAGGGGSIDPSLAPIWKKGQLGGQRVRIRVGQISRNRSRKKAKGGGDGRRGKVGVADANAHWWNQSQGLHVCAVPAALAALACTLNYRSFRGGCGPCTEPLAPRDDSLDSDSALQNSRSFTRGSLILPRSV